MVETGGYKEVSSCGAGRARMRLGNVQQVLVNRV